MLTHRSIRRPSRIAAACLGAVMAASTLAACGGRSASAADPASIGAGPSATGHSRTAAAGYPVTVDNCGTKVTVDKPPQRILTIKSTSLEMLLALGLQDRIVGTAFRDGPVPAKWAKAAAKLPVVAKAVPGREATLALEPDMIFAGWESNLTPQGAGSRSSLKKLGIATYVAPSACKEAKYQPDPMTFDLLWKQIDQAGRIFGVPGRAKALVARQKKKLAAVEPSTAGLTALWYSSGSKVPYVGAGIGAPEMIMKAAGLHNIAAGIHKTWTSLSWESIVAKNPDVIVLIDASWNTAASKIKRLESNPATAALPAVKHHRFVTVPFPAEEAGVRNVDAVRSVVSQLAKLGSR